MIIIKDEWSSRIDISDCNIIDSHKNNNDDDDDNDNKHSNSNSNSQGQMTYCKTNCLT